MDLYLLFNKIISHYLDEIQLYGYQQ